MFHYSINPDSEIPIYRQLVDQINARIRSGAIPADSQLPTVREMARQLHLSCGTVKRAYDRLQEMGDIEMTRRRGTFVKYVHVDSDSRKVQAMTAIDRMIRQLSDLSFSPAEIEIFLNLKMREWGLKWSGLHIAVVTPYIELTAVLEGQLRQLGNVHVSVCSLKQLREYPYSVDEQSDVILADVADAPGLVSILPDSAKLIRVALGLRPESAAALACCAGMRLGVLCEDEAFPGLVSAYLPAATPAPRPCFSLHQLSDLDCIVAARGSALAAELEQSPAQPTPPLVYLDYCIDQGSMLYLEERINRIRDERQLHPRALSF